MIDIVGAVRATKEVLDVISVTGNKREVARYGLACCLVAGCTFGITNDYFVLREQDRELIRAVHAGHETAGKNQFAAWLLEQRLRETRNGLERRGTITIPASELNLAALKMMNEVQFRMLATSSAKGWWNHEFGNEYMARNTNLAVRKDITRIFLYANESELASLRPVLEAQLRAGIQVYIAPLDANATLAEDYVVVDDRMAGRLTLTLDRNPVQADFYFDKEKIEEIKQRISAISANARQFVAGNAEAVLPETGGG
jgi:hypothetical protein